MKTAGIWLTGIALLSLAGVALVVTHAQAAEKDKLKKIVDLVKKGDMDGAKKAAADYAKGNKDVGELMEAFKKGKNGGVMSIGPAGKGIEDNYRDVGRDVPTAANVAKLAKDHEEAGYYTAAIALVTANLPQKGTAKASAKDWVKWSEELTEQGKKFADAAKAKSGADLKAAASKINNTCSACHIPFRQ